MTRTNEQLTGERIDRLMTVEIRPLNGGLPAGFVVPMYEVCRAHHGEPLSSLAARRLTDTLNRGDTVFIATGAGVAPKLPQGETDGPVGAAVLARALILAFRVRVVLVTEDAHAAPVAAVADVINAELVERGNQRAVSVVTFPLGLERGVQIAGALMEEYRPAAVVFVERDGPNKEGFFHGVRGDCRNPEDVGHVYLLADLARKCGVLSVGIGDGGNEVGFGAVRDAITAVHPLGGKSLAGHASGVVTVTATDVVVSASVSNWGAYGIAAALASISKDVDVLHTPQLEHTLIKATVDAGARDGATSKAEVAVDGINWEGHTSFVELLRSIVTVSI
ncbi:MAG TPA: glutamate cyclase domain-containing protein [Paraburkholderia sp.]|uniref:glutamate cyclase domain-containing protein n=1 Tax=Paraburkholderia sp. TaxID=1926495 RepID=UPI002B481DC4|nr:glutamate cyclase domain-containing protein [Paraburkholderia sp.]HKR44484.1 glutamate cyclase domain-containing protein [Paraburkholderia sp.]